MPLRFAPPRDGALEREVLRDLERVLRDVLGETDERLDVRFGAWRAEDGRPSCGLEAAADRRRAT